MVNAMIEHPAVRKINFTGSSRVGRIIASTCGKNLKPCLMELGGKNSAIVCEDADLKTAIGAVLAGSFINVGHTVLEFSLNIKVAYFHSLGKFVWLQIG